MIPVTFPSAMDTILKKDSCVVYFLTSISGLVRWVDYIPVKWVSTSSTKESTFNVDGYQPITALPNITNKVRWLDYIPVYVDNSATVPFSTNANGYIPVGIPYSTVTKIFEPGTVTGAVYDYSNVASLNQTSTGTTPVTAVTNPVGLTLDTRFGLALGPELVDTLNTAAAWTASGTNTVVDDAGAVKITYVDNAAGAVALFSAAAGLSSNLTVGANYKITYEIKVNSGSVNAAVVNASTNQGVAVTSTSFITQSFVFNASNATTNNFTFANMSAGEIVWIKNISVKLIEGNHARQATAAARPTWQVDAGGHHYLSFLGTDDSLTSATGGGGSAGFFWCGVVEPTGGAGTDRILFDDRAALSGRVVYISSLNKLAFMVGNGSAWTNKGSTATINVGTKYLLTAWDDGTNLNVQINSAAAETVARPVVVAGTAGYTIGKDNAVASSYLIGNLYPFVYFKNTAGTAAQRASVQAWVKSKAGL